MSRRQRGGFSLMEVVIAAAISLLVMTGAGVVVANTSKAVNNAIASDTATSLALSILEESIAFGCGLATDPNSLVATATAIRCTDVYKNMGAPTQDGVVIPPGDIEFDTLDSEGRPYTVRLSTRWRQANSGTQCRSTNEAQVGRLQIHRPQLLERTATLEWEVDGVTRSQSFSKLQSAPSGSDFQGPGYGGILVYSGADTLVAVIGEQFIPRYTSTCTGGSAGAAAWFPYLPAGEYEVGIVGGGTRTVDVGADETVEVFL